VVVERGRRSGWWAACKIFLPFSPSPSPSVVFSFLTPPLPGHNRLPLRLFTPKQRGFPFPPFFSPFPFSPNLFLFPLPLLGTLWSGRKVGGFRKMNGYPLFSFPSLSPHSLPLFFSPPLFPSPELTQKTGLPKIGGWSTSGLLFFFPFLFPPFPFFIDSFLLFLFFKHNLGCGESSVPGFNRSYWPLSPPFPSPPFPSYQPPPFPFSPPLFLRRRLGRWQAWMNPKEWE